MGAFQVSEIQDPRSQLHNFVDYFLAVMDEIILRQPTNLNALPDALMSTPLLPSELEGLFREAWGVCREREMYPLHHAIQTVPIERLQSHGLDGPELRAKLSSVATVSTRLWQNPIRTLLAKLLALIDVVLKSIGSAMGGVAAGFIELKEAIENLLS
jgi:hypothetical protein